MSPVNYRNQRWVERLGVFLGVVILSVVVFFTLSMLLPPGGDTAMIIILLIVISLQLSFIIAYLLTSKR